VWINTDKIDPSIDADISYRILRTVIHELCHSYQATAIDDPSASTVPDRVISTWESNYPGFDEATYIQPPPQSMLQAGGSLRPSYDAQSESYREQPIENDAFGFANNAWEQMPKPWDQSPEAGQ